MFTGIIQATALINAIEKRVNFHTYFLQLPEILLINLSVGASVSNNGCCLTVTGIYNNVVSFDLINETLKRTNLSTLKVGDAVNLERSVKMNTEIGGHLMSGHIICTAELTKISYLENNKEFWFNISDKSLMKYLFYKGYIGIDGISLTIGKIINNSFCVYLIPETIERTTIKNKKLGDKVNIEIDFQTQVIVDTLERILINK